MVNENVLERLSCFGGNLDFDFLIENVTPLPLLQEGDGRHFPKQTPLLGNCQRPAQRTQGAILPRRGAWKLEGLDVALLDVIEAHRRD
jgi:hypothetical protein